MKVSAAVLLVVCSYAVASAQKLNVKVVDRQDNQTNYTYVVPGYFSSSSNANANCTAYGDSADCNGSATASGYATPAHEESFQVTGATLSLLLPDGRVVVVNCRSKFAERMAGPEVAAFRWSATSALTSTAIRLSSSGL